MLEPQSHGNRFAKQFSTRNFPGVSGKDNWIAEGKGEKEVFINFATLKLLTMCIYYLF